MSEPKTIEVQIFVRHRDEHGNVTGKGFNQVLAFDAESGLRFARERFAQEVLPTTSNVGPKFTPRLSPKLVRQYVYDWLVGMVMEKMGRVDE